MDLSIVTVTWNSEKYIAEQLRSVIFACRGVEWEQIILDNGSRDNTVVIAEEFARKNSRIRVINNGRNLGFAAANNLGFSQAHGNFILFLNPDMVLRGDIGDFIHWFESRTDVGIAGPKLVSENGVINPAATPRRFPRFFEMCALFFLKAPHFFPRMLDGYLYKNRDWNTEQEVDSVRGSFMLVRRELIAKLGRAFDPRYFLWWEDVDLCREAKRLGYRTIYNPAYECLDSVGASFRQCGLVWKQWRFFIGMVKYFWKWKTRK